MKKILIIFLGFAIFCYFLPQMASSDWGKRKVSAHLEKQLGGKIEISRISLSWLGKQTCHQVEWIDEQNQYCILADQVILHSTIFECLSYKDKPLKLFVEGAKMKCEPNLTFLKKTKNLDICFSPIQAVIDKGVVSFSQFDININKSMRVMTRGKVDMVKNHLDVTFGVPQKTMQKLFGKDLPEDFLLEIPISCKLSTSALEKKLFFFFLKNAFFKL